MTATRFAFFDVDETLISMKSMFDFFPFWCAENATPQLAREFERGFAHARATGVRREELNRQYYRFFRGASLADLVAVGRAWFESRFREGRSPYLASTVSQLRAHQREAVAPVLVSGSMLPLLSPIAIDLSVEHCLCTQLLLDGEQRLTGEIGHPQTIGAGKAIALVAFLRERGAMASDCFAYGDDCSDLPMLEAVGTPIAVGSAEDLLAFAHLRGWRHLAG